MSLKHFLVKRHVEKMALSNSVSFSLLFLGGIFLYYLSCWPMSVPVI